MFQSYSNLKQIINSANQSQICNGPTRWGSVASLWGMSWRNNGRTGYGLLSDIDRTKFNGGASISRETQTMTIGTFLSAIISNDEFKKIWEWNFSRFDCIPFVAASQVTPSRTSAVRPITSSEDKYVQRSSDIRQKKMEQIKSVYLTYKSQFSSSLF